MRGRTNVTQRKQPVINGQLEQFVVENGNVISKGDFVSPVYTKVSYDWRILETFYDKFTVDKSNGKYILILGDYAHLIQFDGSEINILDSLNVAGNQKGCYYDVESNKFIVSPYSVGVTETQVYALEYTITNDEFVFVKNLDLLTLRNDFKTGYMVYTVYFSKIIPYNSGYVCFVTWRSYNSSTNNVSVIFCDTSFTFVSADRSNGIASIDGIFAYKTINGNVFLLKNSIYIYNLILNTIKQFGTSTSLNVTFCDFNDSETVIGNNSYAIKDYDGTPTEVNLPNNVGCFNKDGDFLKLSNGSYSYSDYDEENIIATLKQTENYTFPFTPNTYFSISNNNDEIILFVSSSNQNAITYMFTRYSEQKLYFGDLTNKVKSYDGTAIGFAGGSGNAGDSIPVYVPLSN